MILSAVIHLTPNMQTDFPAALGHKAQGWLLGEVQKYKPELSERLHDEGGYTVSGVHPQLEGQPGQCYLRVTSLVSDLTDVLLEAVLPNIKTVSFSPREGNERRNLNPDNHIPPIEFRVVGYGTEKMDHPLAGTTSFSALIRAASSSEVLDLEFSSPTAFSSNGIDEPRVDVDPVLGSWSRQWEKYAPIGEQFDYSFSQFARDCIVLSGLWDVRTKYWNLPDGKQSLGFEGRIQMRTRRADRCVDWMPIWQRAVRDWQALAAFSLYCGTGHHTAEGMGQTRTR